MVCREKFIKTRLEALQRQQAGDAAAEDTGGAGSAGEESERELWMLQVDLAALQVRACTDQNHTHAQYPCMHCGFGCW